MISRIFILASMTIALCCSAPAADTKSGTSVDVQQIDGLVNDLMWLDPHKDSTRIWDLLDELRELSPAAYCRGLKELAGVQRIRLSYQESIDYYKRHLEECPLDSGVVIPLAEIVERRPDLCGQWVEAVKSKELLPEHDPLDAFDVVLGRFLIRHRCEGLAADESLLNELSRLRAVAAFGAWEPDMALYVRNMVAAELALQDGDSDTALTHLKAALDSICTDATLLKRVVKAFPREEAIDGRHLVHIDAAGLIYELNRLEAEDEFEPDQLRCVTQLEEQIQPMRDELENRLRMEAQGAETEVRVITPDQQKGSEKQ